MQLTVLRSHDDVIEFVKEWTHLGLVMASDSTFDCDISERRIEPLSKAD